VHAVLHYIIYAYITSILRNV